jgi:hypothetical protein
MFTMHPSNHRQNLSNFIIYIIKVSHLIICYRLLGSKLIHYIKLQEGSLYYAIDQLAKSGYIVCVEVVKEGGRPEYSHRNRQVDIYLRTGVQHAVKAHVPVVGFDDFIGYHQSESRPFFFGGIERFA